VTDAIEHAAAKPDPLWKEFEKLVAEIQRDLAPDAEVTHNVKMKGRDSGQLRQVDVLLRKTVGQYEMTVAIDCKDYAQPVDVKGVEEFQGLIRDIGVTKGAMVCPKGFSEAAKKVAARNLIDLFSPVDTDPHKWQAKVSLPMICDFRGAAIGFGLRVTAPVPFRTAMEFWREIEVYDKDGNALGRPVDVALRRWNQGEYPTEPGDHEGVPLFPVAPTLVDNGYGTRTPVTLTVNLRVNQRLFFGNLPIRSIRGLKDEHRGGVVTNAFATDALDAAEVEKTWTRIASEKEAPAKPAMVLVGLDCYEVLA
jgi:hypothetical protein